MSSVKWADSFGFELIPRRVVLHKASGLHVAVQVQNRQTGSLNQFHSAGVAEKIASSRMSRRSSRHSAQIVVALCKTP